MQFLTPLAFLGALLAIPIILLYMLRLRRREVTISSTFLWQQLLQDREANTPWQKLRRNLLLILQLIILTLLVLALARPFITVPTVSAAQTALLIDASASMSAVDSASGETRFDEAKRRALEVVDTLSAGSVMTVIQVGASPQILTPYTGERELLRAAINDTQPESGRADWLTALTLAAEGGRGVEDFSVVIVGDGGLTEANDLPSISIPGEVSFIQVGQSDHNVAITALASRSVPGQPPQLFAQLTNYGSEDAEVVFSLRGDAETVPFVSQTYTIAAKGTRQIVSTEALTQAYSVIQARVTVSVNSAGGDYLAVDNDAWSVSQEGGERTILLVTEGNLFLEQVLRSLPGLEVFRAEVNRPLPTRQYDLYIFDSYLPTTLPAGDVFIINPPSDTPLFNVGAETETVGELEIVSGDDRLAFVDFANVNILRYREVEDTGWATDLITTNGQPLLMAGETQGRQVAVLSFALSNSDLPLQITFPVLISNLMNWFTPGNVLVSNGTLNVGDSVTIRPPLDAEAIRVTAPDGSEEVIPVERDTLLYSQTRTPGIYTLDVLSEGETVLSQVFAINLFNGAESDITPREVTIGGVAVTDEPTEALGQREFWSLIALLALLMLMIEWYAYHRQLRVPTVMTRTRLRSVPASR
jgi:Ca-activated chloride channel homolog